MAIGIYVFGDIKAIPRVDEMTTSKEELRDLEYDIMEFVEQAILAHKKSGNPTRDAARIYTQMIMGLIKEHTKAVLKGVVEELPKNPYLTDNGDTAQVLEAPAHAFTIAVSLTKELLEQRMKEL